MRLPLLHRIDPLWRRAPLLLRWYPGAGLGIAIAVGILVLVSAATPLFVSSAGAQALNEVLGATDARAAGATLFTNGAGPPRAVENVARRVAGRFDGLGALEPTTVAYAGTTFRNYGVETGVPADGEIVDATLYSRSGLLNAIDRLEGERGAQGAWVPNTLARRLGVRAGDELTYRVDDTGDPGARADVRLPVAGVYRDPFERGRLGDDAEPHWSEALVSIPRIPQTLDAPPLLLLDPEGFRAAAAEVGETVTLTWEAPLTQPLSVEAGRELEAGLEQISFDSARTDHPLGQRVRAFTGSGVGLRVESELPEAVEQAGALTGALIGPLQALLLAAQVIALAVVCAAAVLLFRRRTSEARIALALGASPWHLGLRTPA